MPRRSRGPHLPGAVSRVPARRRLQDLKRRSLVRVIRVKRLPNGAGRRAPAKRAVRERGRPREGRGLCRLGARHEQVQVGRGQGGAVSNGSVVRPSLLIQVLQECAKGCRVARQVRRRRLAQRRAVVCVRRRRARGVSCEGRGQKPIPGAVLQVQSMLVCHIAVAPDTDVTKCAPDAVQPSEA